MLKQLLDLYSTFRPSATIADFRNLLTHEYFGVDLEIVWKIVQDDLPALMDAVREILRKESE